MLNLPPISSAILSVSNKQGLVEFAKELHDLGFKLIASGGTANQIRMAEIPVRYLFITSNNVINFIYFQQQQ